MPPLNPSDARSRLRGAGPSVAWSRRLDTVPSPRPLLVAPAVLLVAACGANQASSTDSTSDASTWVSDAAWTGDIQVVDGGNLSGLPWKSGAATSDYVGFEMWRGRPFDVAVSGSTWASWADIEAPYIAPYDGFPGFMQLRIPMLPGTGTSLASGVTFTACATGAYDANFEALGRDLVAKGRGNSHVRLGWEANGNWYPWNAANASSATEWVQCFQHEVTALRAAAPEILIDWNMNAETETPASLNPTDIYPGDAYVDVIGVDFYDFWPALTTDALWTTHYLDSAPGGGPYGIGAWLAFAQSRGKLLAIPEWGIINSSKPNCGCGGDDPVYVKNMHDFFAANAAELAYESYFNLATTPGDTTTIIYPSTTSPDASAEYMHLF